MLAFFFRACYNMRVIKRNARCFRLVTSLSSSFSPLSYMDRAQNRKALCPIHFCREKAKNKQRRCGERKTGKKGEVKGLKRGKGEVKGLKREQSGGGLPVRKPAAVCYREYCFAAMLFFKYGKVVYCSGFIKQCIRPSS